MVVAEAEEAVRVPLGALFRERDRWAVYVVEGGRARLRPVEVGVQDDQYREVRSGLVPGDAVVLFPGSGVDDGKKIAMSH